MTNQDFCYWLQGFFELREDSGTPLTKRQVGLIDRHIKLCEASGEPGPGILAISVLLPLAVGSAEVTRAIGGVLAHVFQHVIDGEDPSGELQHIHNGGKPGGPTTRC